jgi:plasmid stability protein
MPRTLQIRDVDDGVYATLAERAARQGTSVPELVRAELARLASRPAALEWLMSTRRPVVHRDIDAVAGLDAERGPWPDDRP